MSEQSTLSILGSKGDTKLTWDPNDPASCDEARKMVADLKRLGFSFFLLDGRAADEINGGGNGQLVVRKLTAEEVVSPPVPEPEPEVTSGDAPQPKRRGRPPKAKGQNVIATRPVAGG